MGKGDTSKGIWEGFKFDVPGFHDEVFWDCKYYFHSLAMDD